MKNIEDYFVPWVKGIPMYISSHIELAWRQPELHRMMSNENPQVDLLDDFASTEPVGTDDEASANTGQDAAEGQSDVDDDGVVDIDENAEGAPVGIEPEDDDAIVAEVEIEAVSETNESGPDEQEDSEPVRASESH